MKEAQSRESALTGELATQRSRAEAAEASLVRSRGEASALERSIRDMKEQLADDVGIGGKMGGRWRADAAGGTNPFLEQQPGDERGEAVERALRGPRTLYCRTWDRTEFLSARAHGDACV